MDFILLFFISGQFNEEVIHMQNKRTDANCHVEKEENFVLLHFS